ncbi:unnamed protein product [Prunus brigantina]
MFGHFDREELSREKWLRTYNMMVPKLIEVESIVSREMFFSNVYDFKPAGYYKDTGGGALLFSRNAMEHLNDYVVDYFYKIHAVYTYTLKCNKLFIIYLYSNNSLTFVSIQLLQDNRIKKEDTEIRKHCWVLHKPSFSLYYILISPNISIHLLQTREQIIEKIISFFPDLLTDAYEFLLKKGIPRECLFDY